MTIQEFAGLVHEMRQWQRDYFRTRSATALESSRMLEKHVDRECKEIMQGGQLSLFPDVTPQE